VAACRPKGGSLTLRDLQADDQFQRPRDYLPRLPTISGCNSRWVT
jgi:hypothetical protein